MIKQIKAVIDADGNVTMEGIGFKGTACDKAMAALEKAIGIQTKRVNKPEYNAQGIISTTQKVGA
ncbi:MAG: DUF2997 domain-containing protein [Patescibacteria group bacterium]|nr:DUF2997 domain-containing protein [Patescibacteria group bacterium]